MSSYTAKPDDITGKSAAEIASLVKAREVSSAEVTESFLRRIEATNEDLNSFLHISRESALAAAKKVDEKIAKHEDLASPLAGVPLALKDVFTTTDAPTTCGSKILQGWVSPYDATVTKKLREADIPILGKTNMDEFAMGSSTENSAYGVTKNPWDTTKVPGGSGGGSAAALASHQAPIAIGTDTGGSIRQPAALTHTVGVKPTYGTVSRYGLVACASSLDQGGPCGNNVLDVAMLHQVIAGFDPRDSTSANIKIADMVAATVEGQKGDLSGVKVGVVEEISGEGIAAEVKTNFQSTLKVLTDLGAEVVNVSCPNFKYALSAYYLIMPSEVSSNLARFDAMRYGLRVESNNATAAEIMALSREMGFGSEVKRRILLGTYALSAGYYDEYYGKALQVRELVKEDFRKAYEQVDVLVSPTTPTTAFEIGDKVADPLSMYLFDLCTLPTNLAGGCGMSLPTGFGADSKMPIGFQILAPAFKDERLYKVGAAIETALAEN